MSAADKTSPDFYDRALKNIYRNLYVLAAAGSAGFTWWRGWRWGVGFLIGSAAVIGLFAWFHRAVNALGVNKEPRGAAAMAWAIGLRYVLIGALAYGILNNLGVNRTAFLAGLLILAPAVLIEILTELFNDIYGT